MGNLFTLIRFCASCLLQQVSQ
uniref:Uncharacterized protein n=1 Tax=Anguilla anguilla TaxID=7936 RepID=A0A0E9W303_ANGAN